MCPEGKKSLWKHLEMPPIKYTPLKTKSIFEKKNWIAMCNLTKFMIFGDRYGLQI